MATVQEIMEALADQIRANSPIDFLQVTPLLELNPTPPSVDIYPADPFQEALSFGKRDLSFIVRMRVTTADHQDGQRLLLSAMDAAADTSLVEAILTDKRLGGLVDSLSVDGPSAFGVYRSPGNVEGENLLGCQWTVTVLPK